VLTRLKLTVFTPPPPRILENSRINEDAVSAPASIAQQPTARTPSAPYGYDPITGVPYTLAQAQAMSNDYESDRDVVAPPSPPQEQDIQPREDDPAISIRIGNDDMNAPDAAATLILDTNPHIITITASNLNNNTNKYLHIIIPEGLTVANYPGMDSAEMPDNIKEFVSLSKPPDTHTNIINQTSYYGEIIYALTDLTEAATIELAVSVDRFRYYGGSIVLDDLIVKVTGDGDGLPITKEVGITEKATAQFYIANSFASAVAVNREIPTTIGAGLPMYSLLSIGPNNMYSPIPYVPKSAIVTFTYPKEMTLQKVLFTTAYPPNGGLPANLPAEAVECPVEKGGNGSIAWDEPYTSGADHHVYLNFANSGHIGEPKITLQMDDGTPGASYIVTQRVDYITWDDTPLSYTVTVYTVNVLASTAHLPNLLEMPTYANQEVYVPLSASDKIPGLIGLMSMAFRNQKSVPITDQVIRYDFPLGLHVRGFEAPSIGAPKTVTYETYEGTQRTLTGGNSAGNSRLRLAPAALGLLEGESIKWAEVNIGTFAAYFVQTASKENRVAVWGDPDNYESTYTTTVTISTTSLDAPAEPETYYIQTTISPVKKTAMFIDTVIVEPPSNNIFFTADPIKIKSVIYSDRYHFNAGNINLIKDPDIYILVPKNMHIEDGSIILKQGTNDVTFTQFTLPLSDDRWEEYVTIHTSTIIGYMTPELGSYGQIALTFTLKADKTIPTTQLNTNMLVFAKPNDGDPTALVNTWQGRLPAEPIDFNDNGTSETVAGAYNNTIFTIMAEPDLRLTAGIGLTEDTASTYNPDTGESIVPLTDGVNAKYVLNVISTLPDAAGSFTAYIPVPHTGMNYGAEFQESPFVWNMALTGEAVSSSSNYTIEYTTDTITSLDGAVDSAVNSSYKPAENMGASDWKNVTMIRVTNNDPIPPNANDKIVLTYSANDTGATDVPKVNIFRPYFDVVSSVVIGWREGSWVAASIVTGIIEGFVWGDSNRDGLFNGTEQGIDGVEVRLPLPENGVGSDYEPNDPNVTIEIDTGDGSKYARTYTDASGHYTFPNMPGGGAFKVWFVLSPAQRYNYYFTIKDAGSNSQDAIDSDAYPVGGGETYIGVTDDISPIDLAASQHVNAGLCLFQYTVTFDKGDGDTAPSPTSRQVNRPAIYAVLPSVQPTKACHNFIGYYTDMVGGSEFTAATPVDETQTVFARFAEKEFTVTFDGNGATMPPVPSTKTVMCLTGKVDAIPSPPFKDCHTFVGWFDTNAPTGGTQFTAASDVTDDMTVYARYTEDQFTIAFDNNGGDTQADPSTITVNCLNPYVPEMPVPPSKSCHDFVGWFNTPAQSGGTQFFDHTEITPSLDRVYARYDEKQFTVNFQPNGADVGPSPTSKSVMCTVGVLGLLPAPPSKACHTFVGWFDTPNQTGGTKYDPASEITGDKDLYARFTEDEFTINFDKNGGDSLPSPTFKTVNCTSPYIDELPTEPTKQCYDFIGWFDTPNQTGGAEFTGAEPVTASLNRVYARYKEKQFIVNFNSPTAETGANPSYNMVPCTSGVVGTLPTPPVKQCHTFAGWYGTPELTGGQYLSTSEITGDTELYARFTEDQLTIVFDKNGGDTQPDPTSKTVDCTSPFIDEMPAPPYRSCYEFVGWFDTPAQSGGNKFTITSPVTPSLNRVYARYSLIQHTVTFNSNGADAEASPTYKTVSCPNENIDALPNPPVKADYSFIGWFDTCDPTGGTQFTAASQVTADMTVCARYRLTTFIVDFDKNGGDTEASPKQKPVTYPATSVGSLPNPPTKACHTFVGWFNTAYQSGGEQFTATTPVSEHTRVYARYSIIQHAVTFDNNGGDTQANPPAKVVTCPDVTVDALPNPPTKACHTFVGWFSTSAPTGGVQFTAASTVTADKTVYARYAVNQYTISFNSNGGYTEADPRQKTITCPTDTVGALPTPPVRPCHTFVGWFDTPNPTGGTQFTEATTVAADTVVYARFQEIQRTVNFHSNGGDTQPDPLSKTVMCTYGKLGALPTPPSRDCYQFAGWFDTQAATGGNQYSSGTAVNVDRDLYARWRRVTHTITYSRGQATSGVPPTSENVSCGDNYSPTAGAGTLARFGYTFEGWSTTIDGEAITNLADVRDNQTLYPVWKSDDYTLTFILADETAAVENVHVNDDVNLNEEINQPSKLGYTLLGYSTDPEAEKPLIQSQFVLTPKLLQQMLASTHPEARDAVITLYPIFRLNTHTEMHSYFSTVVGNWINPLENEKGPYWDIVEVLAMKIDLQEVPDINP
jgi:uncharacterized repeat protein (TIGR02543 family)